MERSLVEEFKFGIFRHEELVSKTHITHTVREHGFDLFKPLRRGQYSIMLSGPDGAVHYVDDKQVDIPPYSVLFVGPDRLSHFEKEPQRSTHVLFFSSLFYNRSAKDTHFLYNSALFHDFDAVYLLIPPKDTLDYIRGLMSLLYGAQEHFDQEIQQDLVHNVVQQILIVGTLRHHRAMVVDFENTIDNRLVLEFKKLIEKNYASEKTVKFYTDQLNVTDRRLNLATKAVLNLTPKEVITRQLINEAKWQLIHTSKSIKEISAELGYPDEHNFSSFFLKNAGVRPKSFQAKNK